MCGSHSAKRRSSGAIAEVRPHGRGVRCPLSTRKESHFGSLFRVECGARTARSADRSECNEQEPCLKSPHIHRFLYVYRWHTRNECIGIARKKWKLVYKFFLAIPIQGRCNLPLPIYNTKKDIPKDVLVGGMWGSNPRHSEPQIRFRNLLNISRLTIQFNINFCLFWDIFGTLFYIK